MQLTREDMEKLASDDITVKEQKDLQNRFNEKCGQIWHFICKKYNKKLDWFSFSNDTEYDSGDGSDGGYFDPKDYSEYVEFIGGYKRTYDDFPFDNGFDTSLLFVSDSDWQDHIERAVIDWKDEVEADKAAAKQKRENQKALKKAMKEQIIKKLTKEELKFIKFKD